MKALSLKPPWHWAVFEAGKWIENRSWKTNYRGPLLIHVSKNFDMDGWCFLTNLGLETEAGDHFVPPTEAECSDVIGHIIGRVDIVGCYVLTPFLRRVWNTRWAFGPYCWILEDARLFERRIPYRGRLGLFGVPEEFLTGATCA